MASALAVVVVVATVAALAALDARRKRRAGVGCISRRCSNRRCPTLIVLDDIHLSGHVPSGLAAAARSAAQPPVLIALSYDSSAAGPELVKAVIQLDPGGARTWDLRRLPAEAGAEVVSRVVPDSDRDRLLDVATGADGHPRVLRTRLTEALEQVAEQRLRHAVRMAEQARQGLNPARSAVATEVLDFRNARAERIAAHADDLVASGGCPYKGLARYESADARYFVGRERLTAQLVARLAEDDLVVIVGASGSGKSAVARAGLLAALREGALPGSASWPHVVVIPGRDALVALRQSVDRATADTPLVVLIDQFEELFTACDQEMRTSFVAEVLALRRRGARVVLTLRADYYGHFASHPELSERTGPKTENRTPDHIVHARRLFRS